MRWAASSCWSATSDTCINGGACGSPRLRPRSRKGVVRMSSVTPEEDGVATAHSLPHDAAKLAHDLLLRDGSVVHVRPIHADDTVRLQSFHARLSMESIVWRFFRSVPALSEEQARQFTHVDYVNRMALLATRGEGAAAE